MTLATWAPRGPAPAVPAAHGLATPRAPALPLLGATPASGRGPGLAAATAAALAGAGAGARSCGLRLQRRRRGCQAASPPLVLRRERQSTGGESHGQEVFEERRRNSWDGKWYTFGELRKLGERVSWSEEELQEHWAKRCAPGPAPGGGGGSAAAAAATFAAAAPPPEQEQVVAWRRMWTFGSLQPMWTKADAMHVHAVSGIAYTLLGAAYLLDTAARDAAALGGAQMAQHVPVEAAMVAILLGSVNAASALQPALIAKSAGELPQILGLGPGANLKSGGFINTCIFFFVLTYQGLRALPSFPPFLAPLDALVGLTALLATAHTASILSGWVAKGAMHRVDAVILPPLLNAPVALHLLLQGQPWVDQLAARYQAFPEVFFTANFALAWSLSMVTFLLSLQERRVLSVEARSFLMVTFPVLVFTTIPLHVAVHIPEWLQADWLTMLTLNPPSA